MKSAVPGIGSAYRDECENVGCMGVWERALLACRCKVAGALVAGALVALVAGALVGVMYTCWKRTLKIGCTGYARVMYVSCINITCSKSTPLLRRCIAVGQIFNCVKASPSCSSLGPLLVCCGKGFLQCPNDSWDWRGCLSLLAYFFSVHQHACRNTNTLSGRFQLLPA